ncbi:MAG: lysophospholipid acyltransferase family protein [Firmicutes bacterium]|nr:lysophospholipid acyltransferase family protein [Bacillota bacterium]MCM1401678.1 lysophospholipid acyltransferase family protein [Bacteroides sp.]MCM1477545.1 lysophospholipid acyltransferase family protein [Bacteroides sp.]
MAEKIKYYLYLCLFMPLAWLPLWVLYRFSDILYFIFRYCIHYRRNVIRINLTSSFPEKSETELRDIEGRFYRQLTDNMVETIKLLCISNRCIDRRVSVKNASLVEQAADDGVPVFLYLGHVCNWEWVPAITHHFNRPKITSQIYKPMRNKAFDRLMLKVRSRFNALNIPQTNALRTLFKLKKEDGTFIVGILDDHCPNHGRSHHYMTFLSHPGTIINVGAEEIGNRLGARYLYLDIERTSRGHYTLTFKPIVTDPEIDGTDYPVSRAYMRMLEQTIRRQPPYWLWSHKRWRYSQSAPNPYKKKQSRQ